MEQSLLEQNSVKDVKAVSIPQTHCITVQNEIHPQYQTTGRVQIPQEQSQSLTPEKIAIRGYRENEQHPSLENLGKWPDNQAEKCLF